MKILVVGSGGREHALVWKLKQSRHDPELHCAPGNAGIADLAHCVDIDVSDLPALRDYARRAKIDLTIVGPEVPLCAGIVDLFKKEGLRIFGPDALAARLEGDKAWAKDVLARHKIPTANHRTFKEMAAALAYVQDTVDYPLVVKASGLAAGKGVTICGNSEEAAAAVREAMGSRRFGSAGDVVVIEDFLEGEEASIIALTDGKTIAVLESSQDHKRAHDGDRGPNTGGMGAYSPAPVVTPALQREIEEQILVPMVHAMKEERCPFNGVLFAGLMMTRKGPKVLEFNVRFGDPECQALMVRLRSDLVDLILGCVDRKLDEVELAWDPRPAVTVVVAQEGYPGTVSAHSEIKGLDRFAADPDLMIFHAGTKGGRGGRVYASGGRVLNVTALGKTYREAVDRAYAAIDALDFPHSFCRRDIAHRVL
ncbi:MAG: phosphoribosylamine--glycine ligase [Planctomycetota bacterium]